MTAHLGADQLSAYLDGEVTGPERDRLDAHLAGCPSCAAQKDAMSGVVKAVANLPRPTMTAAEASAIRQAVLRQFPAGATAPAPGGHGGGWRRWLTWKIYATAGAVALVVVGIAGYATLRPATHSRPTARAALGLAPQPSPTDVGLTTPDEARAFGEALVGPAATPVPRALTVPGSASQPFGLSGSDSNRTAASPQDPLDACIAKVVSSAGPQAVALANAPVTYQGQPAWAIVVSSATPNVAAVFVESSPACTLLTTATFTR